MYNNVPKLRFKEFSNNWSEVQLNILLDFKNGINAPREKYGSGIKFINVLDILNNNYITYDRILGSINIDKNTIENYAVDYGDILFQRSSETNEEVGTANVYLDNKRAVFGGFVIRGKKIGEYNPVFMNFLLKSPLARVEIMKKSGGSTRYNLSQSTLSSVHVFTTVEMEQLKIADFLSTIDSRLTLQLEKVDTLLELKKGCMQKIFSQEIRFKREDGGEYPDWIEKKLGDIADVRDGTHDSPKYVKDGYPLVTSKNLQLDGKLNLKNVSYITFEDYEKINQRSMVSCGDILFGMIGTIGNPVRICSEKFAIKNVALIKESNSNEILMNKYLVHYLKSSVVNKQFKFEQAGNTVKFIALGLIRNLKIFVPTKSEQHKIADFLSTLDSKIDIETQILSTIQTLKKGLLQQMFV